MVIGVCFRFLTESTLHRQCCCGSNKYLPWVTSFFTGDTFPFCQILYWAKINIGTIKNSFFILLPFFCFIYYFFKFQELQILVFKTIEVILLKIFIVLFLFSKFFTAYLIAISNTFSFFVF